MVLELSSYLDHEEGKNKGFNKCMLHKTREEL